MIYQPFHSLHGVRVRWEPARIYHVNATKTRATSGTEMAGCEKCDGFYHKYLWFNIKCLKCVA